MDCFELACNDDTQDSPQAKLIRNLEYMSTLLVDAVNTRSFTYGPDIPLREIHPAWRNVIPSFTATPEYHSVAGRRTRSLKELLHLFKKVTDEHPEMRITVLDVSSDVIVQELPNGAIDVFLSMKTTGFPVGVARHSVAILKWRLIGRKERWMCVAYEGVQGMLEGEGGKRCCGTL